MTVNTSSIGDKNKTEKRYLYLTSSVNNDMANSLIKDMLKYESEDPMKDIMMIINSPGGYIDCMWSIIDCMNMISCDVHTLGIGSISSAALNILAAGSKGKRYATPNSRLMLHQISSYCGGKCEDMQVHMDNVKYLQKKSDELILQRTKLKKNQLEDFLRNDFYMSPEQALEFGFIDKIVEKTLNLKVR